MVGCSAEEIVIGAIASTFSPLASITNSCSVGIVKPFGGTKALRLLVNAIRPSGSGIGPRLSTP